MKNTSYSEKDIVPIMEEVIKSGGSCKLRVTGYSMNPPKKDEIVFIKRDTGKHVLHRIRKIINDECFIMNGDAQMWTEIVRFDQVIGVAESFYRDEKLISCDSKRYKIYMKLWVLCKPIRPLIFRMASVVRKFKRK